MAYTFAPDGQSIISGGNGGILIAYDLPGKILGEFVGHEGAVFAVTPSADGRLLVSGSADQTIRLWNLKTRELIVTLFHGTDGEWVMWTPQGYYTGSPGADKIVGWQINKGPDKEADYVGADQLRVHLNRPDIVDKAIILASAEQAVRESPGTSFRLTGLLAMPVPRFRIVSPAPNSTHRDGCVQIKITIEAVPDPIWAMRVQVNGRQVSEITARTGSGAFSPANTTSMCRSARAAMRCASPLPTPSVTRPRRCCSTTKPVETSTSAVRCTSWRSVWSAILALATRAGLTVQKVATRGLLAPTPANSQMLRLLGSGQCTPK